MDDDFSKAFEVLTGHAPFPWQQTLYEQWFTKGKFPTSCNLPTGLGKTNVIAVWLIALIHHPGKMPRRLVYVVNRRTVVDQTTDEVVKLHKNLPKLDNLPDHVQELAISTLRGQYADNREWSADPSRPAVICGTVDMIGSRLLFSGYGVGFKAKPLHAGFLGQDVLLVHDEAHLEPAFQELLIAIAKEQGEGERSEPMSWPKLRVMELSATTRKRNQGVARTDNPFELLDEDRSHRIVKQRIEATKLLTLTAVDDDKQLADKIAELALKRRKDEHGNDTNAAVLVFVRTLDDVAKVCTELTDKKNGVGTDHVQQLTGTMRGMERDALAERDPVFMRFLPEKSRNPAVTPTAGTVYLICTSAGEVGIDISADHMVCDLSTFDSMAQRFGRVNRYGDRTDTRIDVVNPISFGKTDKKTGELKADEIDKRRQKTLELLKKLPSLGKDQYDASPLALSKIDADARLAAFAPEPVILPATDILFDAWALTSIREKMPGRPEVAPYLHGIADETSQTAIAWRAELDLLTDESVPQNQRTDPRKALQAIFAKHRIRPHETVTIKSYRVIKFFEIITKKRPALRDTRVAIQFSRQLILTTIGELIDKPGPLDADPTLVLPASFGYLDDKGMLSADAIPPEPTSGETLSRPSLDIADHEGYEPVPDAPARLRVLVERTDDGWRVDSLPGGRPLPEDLKREWNDKTSTRLFKDLAQKTDLQIRCVQPIVFNDDNEAVRSLVALTHVRARPKQEQPLSEHVGAVENEAARIADNLKLPEPFRSALLFAAKWHDEGKKADIWQRFIGQSEEQRRIGEYKGKSADWCNPKKLAGYRHEFGSLVRVEHPAQHATACVLPDDPGVKDLALHLIAAHHGFARPHFSHTYVKGFTTPQSDQVHTETIRRYARLQRKYGRWGLAYLESLLRAADIAASGDLESEDDVEAPEDDEA